MYIIIITFLCVYSIGWTYRILRVNCQLIAILDFMMPSPLTHTHTQCIMRALQFSRDTCLTNLSFIFPLDRRCSSGFRWKLSLFRICQIGVAHIIYAYSKAAAASFVTHFIFFSSHSTTVIPYKLYIRRNTMHTYL
jgi:hypothetical protein